MRLLPVCMPTDVIGNIDVTGDVSTVHVRLNFFLTRQE